MKEVLIRDMSKSELTTYLKEEDSDKQRMALDADLIYRKKIVE